MDEQTADAIVALQGQVSVLKVAILVLIGTMDDSARTRVRAALESIGTPTDAATYIEPGIKSAQIAANNLLDDFAKLLTTNHGDSP